MLPYGAMAAVQSTSVVSALVYDCCEYFVFYGGLCEFFLPSPRIEMDDPYFSPLQPPEYMVLEYTIINTWYMATAETLQ